MQKKKQKIFERRPKQIPLQTSGYVPESNHAFALLIFIPPQFSLMLRLKSIIFYQNKPKIKLAFQKHKIFRVLGGFASRPPMASGGAPRPPRAQPLSTADF